MIHWYSSLLDSNLTIGTCAITEIGFVRVSVQAGLESDVPAAVETLAGLKSSSRIPFKLVLDKIGSDRLPSYVLGAKQVTDGHLMELAKESSMRLATLDKSIPGAYVIP